MTTITAILTSHNRCESTIECLRCLERADTVDAVTIMAVLVDDDSIDGTAYAIAKRFPWVQIVKGNGALFWNRGMHRGMEVAMRMSSEYLLWLNDDTYLFDDAVQCLIRTSDNLMNELGQPVIVVGTTSDRASQPTYGGMVSAGGWRPLTFHKVWHEFEPVECEAMNGNVVLIPSEIARTVGNLDPVFEHAMGDIDYALRARKHGFRVFVAPGFVGVCSKNPGQQMFFDASLPLSERWKKFMHKKGLPPKSWFQLTRRHGGWFWPLYFAWPYVRVLVASFVRNDR